MANLHEHRRRQAWVTRRAGARLLLERGVPYVHGVETLPESLCYVARSLELARGFRAFMPSLTRILAARPSARVPIVGGDQVSYGHHLPNGETFRHKMLAELGDSLLVRGSW
jgi:hypothetical protein